MIKSGIHIQDKQIGFGYPVFIIAEAGVNHNGDPKIAKALIHAAKKCGANCVKFQTFKAERVVTTNAPKATYQLKTTDSHESQLDMLKKLELPEHTYHELVQECRNVGIIFLSTPYNIEDVDFLDSIGVSAFKVASGQAVEPYFLEYVARKDKPILLSTGMCTLAEVDEAVRTIRSTGNNRIILLQCTTNYPSAIEDANLLAMQTMSEAFDVIVGYSDHTQSLTASIVAVALGACVIERHFTLDKTLHGPDHSSSSDPEEFSQLVTHVREVEACLGSRMKFPSADEIQNAKGMRRSIVAKSFIPAGTILTLENIIMKRPLTGLPGNMVKYLLGRQTIQDLEPDAFITFDRIK